jgi:hypothetical protein
VKALSKHRLVIATVALCMVSSSGCARQPVNAKSSAGAQPWTFAVSGDSRNCGNIVMPAIAAGARKDHAAFYWHLGDLRAIYKVDEDYARERRFQAYVLPPTINDYLHTAWTDFSQHQVEPFGNMPFFIGIGNHELYPPKTRDQFLIEFQGLLDRPELARQRADDDALARIAQRPAPKTYYHWVEQGVDFFNLDNATDDTFDVVQLAWFDALVDADIANPAIRTLVVGMHESLPYSRSDGHSMCGTYSGRASGTHVYARLVEAQARSKHVYVLASHSHFYLENVFDTAHWRDPANGGVVLPGWVVGTAGAVRYPLPAGVTPGPGAREHVYGYLTGTVNAAGTIDFAFHQLDEPDLQAARSNDYVADDVSFCVAQNPDPKVLEATRPLPITCEDALLR